MAYFQNYCGLPDEFSGQVRLFPLPNLVMFPYVMQPLHIFEPRYLQMLEEAMANDRLIAMAHLMPGWEPEYDGAPPIAPVVCVCKVIAEAEESGGRKNIFVLGLQRCRVRCEHPLTKAFRTAEVAPVDDHYPPNAVGYRGALQRQLIDRFRESLPSATAFGEQVEQLLAPPVPLGMLTDIIAFTLGLDLPQKLQLLSEANVDNRARVLLEFLTATSSPAPHRPFPPEFSLN